MEEKDLYPHIKEFLCKNKDCVNEYVGNELSFRDFRTDVYGVSIDDDRNKIIYLLEGKLWLDGRNIFSKVLAETSYLDSYADYIYIFGKTKDNFEKVSSSIKECQDKGIGILVVDDNNEVYEFLKAKKRNIDNFNKKETLFRIFNKNFRSKDQKTFIADFILQTTYEYTLKTNEKCVKFIEIYNALFSNNEYRTILRKILGKKHLLNEIGMRSAFQKEYNKSDFIKIRDGNQRIEDLLCINEKTLEIIKPPILLD